MIFEKFIFFFFIAPEKPAKLEQVQQTHQQTYVPQTSSVLQNLKEDKTVPIKGIQKAMVKTMTQANTIPHFSYCDEYDMNNLVQMKYQLKELGKERGVKISFLPILIKVSLV